jgi:hypothetical protein
MRRHIAVPVLLALSLSACTTDNGDVGSQAPAALPSSAAAANPGKAALRSALGLPEKPDFLLPVTGGTDSRTLPVFEPAENAYTIHALCTGEGTMTILYGPDDSDPSEIVCGGPVTIGRVHTVSDEEEHLSVEVHGADVHWSMAVLSGTPPMG